MLPTDEQLLAKKLFLDRKDKFLTVAMGSFDSHKKSLSDEDFIMHCIFVINKFAFDPEIANSFATIIQDAYPDIWPRVNKLMILK